MSAVTAVPIRPLAKGAVLKLWIGLLVLVGAGLALAWFGTDALQRERTASGLEYQVIEEGEGATITAADLVQFHILGRRADGSVFFSSFGGEALTGSSGTSPIPAIGEALTLMRPGAHYRVWTTARAAFAAGAPPQWQVSPSDVVSFDVRVLNVLPGLAGMQSLMGGGPGGPGGPPPGPPTP